VTKFKDVVYSTNLCFGGLVFVEKKVFWNCLLGAKLLQQMDDIPHSDNLLRLCQAFKLASFWLV
jgi:hypothetical protein